MGNDMKTYTIPITWQSYKTYDVEAGNLQEAVEKALKQFISEPDDNYLDDSFEVDSEIVLEDYEPEIFDFHQAVQKL